MPDDTRAVATTQSRDLATMPLTDAIEAYTPNLATALPAHIPVERFKRMVFTAISTNPQLTRADRRTLFNACVKCAVDGLLPDGREAALVLYGKEVQYMPMVAGIRKRMRNSGEVISAEAHAVFSNDAFEYALGDDGFIRHRPPSLDKDRGDLVGSYAIIRLKNGEVIREIMTLAEINRIQMFSKAKDGPAWKNWKPEMARKACLRRASKAVPQNSEIEELFRHAEQDEAERPHSIPPRPQPEDFYDTETGEVIEAPHGDPDVDGLPSHVMTPEPPTEDEWDAIDELTAHDDEGEGEAGAGLDEPVAKAEPGVSVALAELLTQLANCPTAQKCDALALTKGAVIRALTPDERAQWSSAYLARKDQVAR